MTVTLDGNEMDIVLNAEVREDKSVTIPDWINQNPELDTNVWNKKVIKIIYIIRTTDALKWILDQLLTGHTLKTLSDTTYSLSGNVWVLSIEAEYEGHTNWSKPWRIRLELIGEDL